MTFPKRLLLLVGGIVGIGGSACAFALVVTYKPWGVPDHRRAEYDAILANWDHQDQVREYWAEKAKPVVHLPFHAHRFGLCEIGEAVSHSFRVENRGDAPLELSFEAVGCDCLTAEVGETAVPPGQDTEVRVSVTHADEVHKDHWVEIATNDPLRSKIKLSVSGKVRKDFVAPDYFTFEVSDPVERTTGNFSVYSQLWDDFEVVDVKCGDREIFDWHAEPLPKNAREYKENSARSAWRVQVWTTGLDYGRYAGELQITVSPTDSEQSVQRDVRFAGRVRSPIVFHSPDIHVSDGLDIGTLNAGKEHHFHMLVRLRGDVHREMAVLDVKPNQLRASLSPLEKQGDFRLTLTVPKDCSMVVFNAAEKHGYVQVGDPSDKSFSSWFPVHGAVVELSQ